MLSEIERDEIYGEPKEIDGDTIIWESRGNKDRFYLKSRLEGQMEKKCI